MNKNAIPEKAAPKTYAKPVLIKLGSVTEMTCGNTGSGGDGNGRKPRGQG